MSYYFSFRSRYKIYSELFLYFLYPYVLLELHPSLTVIISFGFKWSKLFGTSKNKYYLKLYDLTFDEDLNPTYTLTSGDLFVDNNNQVQPTHVDGLDYKALYKVLESEVETIVLDPNCPQYVKDWGQRIMQRLAQHLPR